MVSSSQFPKTRGAQTRADSSAALQRKVAQQQSSRLATRTVVEAAIEEYVLAPLREECALALYGVRGEVGVVIDKTDSQLREMSRCAAFADGLDFSTDEGSGRYVLYRNREEIQQAYGLYFCGVPNAGLKFTVHPLVGMQWRENEFDDRAKSAARQLSRMWERAISAMGKQAPAASVLIQDTANGRAQTLDQASGVIQSAVVINFNEDSRGPRRRPAR